MWVRSPLEETIFIYIYIFISSLWCGGKSRRWDPPLNTQASRAQRKVGNIRFPLPTLLSALRDTAWNWFDFKKQLIILSILTEVEEEEEEEGEVGNLNFYILKSINFEIGVWIWKKLKQREISYLFILFVEFNSYLLWLFLPWTKQTYSQIENLYSNSFKKVFFHRFS